MGLLILLPYIVRSKISKMSSPAFFARLFYHSKAITPYLHGEIKSLAERDRDASLICIERSSSDTIRQLYESLQQAHPEAGAAYWLTRTWTLVCWQPIFVAFTAIYTCRGLPKLSSMAQHVQPSFISGYQFTSTEVWQGSEEELIERAGQELMRLFDYFRLEMSEWTRIRPGFTQHLFADGLLGCLVRLSETHPELSGEYLFQHAHLWLRACGLPEKLASSLNYQAGTKQLTLVRTSCCLVYKCQGRPLCRDCPRHPDNKR